MGFSISKRCFHLISALLTGVSLAACGSKGNSVTSATETVTPGNSSPNGPTPISLICDATRITGYGGGSGTVADPYNICSTLHWNYFANDSASWGKYFRLYSDLDFTGFTAATFNSIGSATTPFTGNFDGNGYRIKNLTLTGITQSKAIFLKTDSNAKISNLVLKDISFTGTARLSGLVLDHGSGGTLTLDQITADTLGLYITGGAANVGGLVGDSAGPLAISNISLNAINLGNPGFSASSWGSVFGTGAAGASLSNIVGTTVVVNAGYGSSDTIGGIGGFLQGSSSFTDIKVTGLDVKGTQAGGLISWTTSGTQITITRVRLSGAVDGGTDAGGLLYISWGASNPAVSIVDSSFEGNIVCAISCGGLVSTVNNGKNVSITRSFYKGNLLNVWNGTGGGLLARAQGAGSLVTITDSYAISNMSNTHATNYLIAGLMGTAAGTVNITRSYYAGSLSGTAPRACTANPAPSTVFTAVDTYFDSTLCTVNAGPSGAIAGVSGVSTGSLQTSTPFTNWSPTVWTFSAGKNPKLAWEP